MNEKQKALLKTINEFKVDLWGNPKRPDDVQENCCEHCGKPLGKNPLYVHVNTNGTILPNGVQEEDLPGIGMQSQGCFPIGINCAKKLLGKKLPLYTFTYEKKT